MEKPVFRDKYNLIDVSLILRPIRYAALDSLGIEYAINVTENIFSGF